MAQNFDDEFLSDFLDGNLSGEELARAERLMLEDVAFREQVESWRAISRQCQSLPKCSLPAGFADLIVSRAFVSPPMTDAPVGQGSTATPAASNGINRPVKNAIRWSSPLVFAGALAASLLLGFFFFTWNSAPDQHLALQDDQVEHGELVNGRLRPIPFEKFEPMTVEDAPAPNDGPAMRSDIQKNLRAKDSDRTLIRTEKKLASDDVVAAAQPANRSNQIDKSGNAAGADSPLNDQQNAPQIASADVTVLGRSSGRGNREPGRFESSLSSDESKSDELRSIPAEVANEQGILSRVGYSDVWILEVVVEESDHLRKAEQLSEFDLKSKTSAGRILGETQARALDLSQQNLFAVSGSPKELAHFKSLISEAFPNAMIRSETNRMALSESKPSAKEVQADEADAEIQDHKESGIVPPLDNVLRVEFLGHQSLNQSILEHFEQSLAMQTGEAKQHAASPRSRLLGIGGLDEGEAEGKTGKKLDRSGRQSDAAEIVSERAVDVEKSNSSQQFLRENQHRVLLIIKPRS